MPASIWIVMPTYNEAANLDAIVRATATEMTRLAAGPFRILIVDDNSPDGTGGIADGLAAEISEVEVLHRPGKAGIGQAYLAGFELALAGGAELRVRDGRRLLPRARVTSGPCWRRRKPPTSYSARATSTAAASRTGGSCAGSSAAVGASTPV